MTRFSKRVTVYLNDQRIQNAHVYKVHDEDGIREVVVNLYRVAENSAREVPESVGVD